MAIYLAQDKPDKVIEYYRGKLAANHAGEPIEESKDQWAATLKAADAAQGKAIQVTVAAKESGSMISFLTTRKK